MKAFLFLTGLAPMAVIFAVRLWGSYPASAIALAVVALCLIVLLPLALRERGKTTSQPFSVASVRDDSHQIPTYLLTYVFPFLFVSVSGWQDLVAYGVFVLLLVVLLLRTDLALVNPLLLAVGYHMYAISTTTGSELTVVSRERLLVGNRILAVKLADSAYKLDRILSEEE